MLFRTIRIMVDVVPSSVWKKADPCLAQAKFRKIMQQEFSQPRNYWFGVNVETIEENLQKLRRQSECVFLGNK